MIKRILLAIFFSILFCGQAFAAGDIIDRWATDAEVTAQTREDKGITPSSIPYITAGASETSESLHIDVKEENTSAISKGQVCAITGSSGSKIRIGLADCDDVTKIRNIGLASDAITQNSDGTVIYKGIIENVDTRDVVGGNDVNPGSEVWAAGDLLWVSTTAGGMTNVRPTSGRCIKAARTVKGNSNVDTLIIISYGNAIWATAASGEDVVVRMGDSAGANKVSWRDYANGEVASLDSGGVFAVSGDPSSGGQVGNRDYNDDRYTGALSYGIMWNENQDKYIRTGDDYLAVHELMKRCILSDAGAVVYYLDATTSYNRDGVPPSVTGTCDANATKKITDTGVFTGASADYVGRYVKNITDSTYSMITAKDDNDTLSLQTDIFVIGETFEVCTAVLDGSDGQVMVEIPAFYHKYSWENGWHKHSISLTQTSGYTLHHTFQKNGANVTARYMSAYEGVLYDTSESKSVNGLYLPSDASYKMSFNGTTEIITSDTLTHPFSNLEAGVDKLVISGTVSNNLTVGITAVTDTTITTDGNLTDEANKACVIQVQRDWTALSGDVLASVSGKALMNQGTRAQFRVVADNRGTGWRQQSFDLVSAVQLLYIIEYGNWNSQSVIGNGLTDWSGANWAAWNNYNPIEKTGLSNILGNATGNTSNGDGATGSYMSYRGIENFYGHLWKWVDGININNNIPYVCNVDTQFADDTVTDYTALGVTLTNANGYQVTLEQIARGFLPASVGGSSSTYITDYYYQNTGWRVSKLGGAGYDGAHSGVVYWDLYNSSGSAFRRLAGRLSE